MAYADLDLDYATLTVRPLGWHRFLALKWSIVVARANVVGVERGGRLAENGPVGLRLPGANLPGYYLAGTFQKFWGNRAKRVRSFWIRRHPDQCIRIDLANHNYDYLMVEVPDPDLEIARIRAWLQP